MPEFCLCEECADALRAIKTRAEGLHDERAFAASDLADAAAAQDWQQVLCVALALLNCAERRANIKPN